MSAQLRVLEPGMLTTVQDLGRSGYSSLGVAIGGAADSFSLRVGNRLVGNSDSAAGLEFTLTGGLFEFEKDTAIAVTGGIADALRNESPFPMWSPIHVRAGERVRIGPVRRGVRVYLSIAGGIEVKDVLGSASTHLAAGFGGHEGRALRSGDALNYRESAEQTSDIDARVLGTDLLHRRTIRAIEATLEGHFKREAAESFWASEFAVSNHSDRAGIRLEGADEIQSLCHGRMTSEGMTHGVIEVPENGQPIVLGVDHPTTGGYPVIGCVASVDLPILGQLRPREKVRFERVSVNDARKLLIEREAELGRVLPQRPELS